MLTSPECEGVGVRGLLVNLIIIIFQSSSQGASTSLHYFIGSAEKRRKTTYKRNVNNIQQGTVLCCDPMGLFLIGSDTATG